ncbi:hypothetical protein VTL71DRAFT_12365 [Oculimacula yallundae]|uniref:Uncharacterized protein n=1 Tax=Oculimacula yallundae TaxID=86028 RepID=A0ABR4CMF3_9HELO
MHLLYPQTLLPILLAFTPLSTALSEAQAQAQPELDLTPRNIPDLSNLQDSPSLEDRNIPDLSNLQDSPEDSSPLEDRQVAAGGGLAATTLAPSQYPVSTTAGSLFTVNGVTSATYKLFVQTFATTALGGWELGPTPRPGVIGLGDIKGEVGKVRSKRAVETDGF